MQSQLSRRTTFDLKVGEAPEVHALSRQKYRQVVNSKLESIPPDGEMESDEADNGRFESERKNTMLSTTNTTTLLKTNDTLVDTSNVNAVLHRLVRLDTSEPTPKGQEVISALWDPTKPPLKHADFKLVSGKVLPWIEPSPTARTKANGMSFWSLGPMKDVGPHCIDGSVCIAPQNVKHDRLAFVFDREFKLSSGASDETLTFVHYQLQPTIAYDQKDLWIDLCETIEGYVVRSETKMRTSSNSTRDVTTTSEHSTSSHPSPASEETLPSLGDSTFFRLENQIPCIGPVCAVQHCLCRCWFDETQTPSDRFDAMVLFFWDDLYNQPLNELGLDESNQWAVSFMITCLERYRPSPEEISKDPFSQIVWKHAMDELQKGQ